eukprot:Skav228181  [mRNA]  locus=scaffold3933:225967:236180:+ [translate_table: standard]
MRQNQLRQLQNQEALAGPGGRAGTHQGGGHGLPVVTWMVGAEPSDGHIQQINLTQSPIFASCPCWIFQMALGPGRRDPGPTPAMYGANEGPGGPFPPDLQHLFSLAAAAQATQGPGLGRKLQ